MNESEACSALLVRAYETLPAGHSSSHWTEDDRSWATRAALQIDGENVSPNAFIGRRASLAAGRLCERDKNAGKLLRALIWRPWIGWLLALVALAAGMATNALTPARQINVLAPPLLAVLAWNLFIYAALIVRAFKRLTGNGPPHFHALTRHIVRAINAIAVPRNVAGLAPPLANFSTSWINASAPLAMARLVRILHIAAITFAIGALLGIYLRGFALEYRAGWESTFLEASAVHTLLSLVLGPASLITGIKLPEVAQLAAIQFSLSGGENAARWIHLYAVTVGLFVVLPRTVMALVQWVRERRLADDFPLPLQEGYFQTLVRTHQNDVAKVFIVPYSYLPSAQATLGIRTLMMRTLGEGSIVTVSTMVPFGGEDTLEPALIPEGPIALVAALFSLNATPERENHSVFIDALAARIAQAAPLAILIDESAFRQHFDVSSGTGATRYSERRAAWQRMFAASGNEPLFVDLEQHDFRKAERDLRTVLDQAVIHAKQG